MTRKGGTLKIRLLWKKYESFEAACNSKKDKSCVYMQCSKSEVLRIGRASKGLAARYTYGYIPTLDAAMHNSRNKILVATVPSAKCEVIEETLLQQIPTTYNVRRKKPKVKVEMQHENIVIKNGKTRYKWCGGR